MSTPYGSVPTQSALLPPSPLTLGQALSAALKVFQRRFGLFLGLIALALVGAVAVSFAALVPAVLWLMARTTPSGRLNNGEAAQVMGALGLAMLVMFVLVVLIQIKVQGMTVLLAHETLLDRRPSLSDLNQGTRGIIGRSLVLLGLGLLAYLAMLAVVGAVMLPVLAASGGTLGRTPERMLSMFPLLMLVYLVLMVVGVYVSVRLSYVYQALAVERASGLAVLRHSWRLTQGEFWRTLGWMVAVGLVVWLVMTVLMLLMGVFAPSDSGGNAALSGLMSLLIFAVELFYVPFLTAFQTAMYIDQVRRKTLASSAGWRGAASGFAAPGQGYVPGAAPSAQPGWVPDGQAGSGGQPGTQPWPGGLSGGAATPGASAPFTYGAPARLDAAGSTRVPGPTGPDAYGHGPYTATPSAGAESPFARPAPEAPEVGSSVAGSSAEPAPGDGASDASASGPRWVREPDDPDQEGRA